MTNAVEIYKGVLHELNKFQSPDFDVDDFNHFVNQAVEVWLAGELKAFEVTQIVSDDLSPVIRSTKETPFFSFNPTNSTDVREKTVPDDYRNVLTCLVTIRYKAGTNAFSVGNKRYDFTKRLSGDAFASIMDNRYFRPLVSDSEMRLYHRVTGSKLGILLDTPKYPNTDVVIESVDMEYLSQPDPIELDEDYEIVTDTIFSESVNRKIAMICTRLFRENHQNERFSQAPAENSPV
jgi:hypothetical protein